MMNKFATGIGELRNVIIARQVNSCGIKWNINGTLRAQRIHVSGDNRLKRGNSIRTFLYFEACAGTADNHRRAGSDSSNLVTGAFGDNGNRNDDTLEQAEIADNNTTKRSGAAEIA